MALEEILCAEAGKDLIKVFSKNRVAIHFDHALGVAVEKEESEVAYVAGIVVDAVEENYRVCAGLCRCEESQLVVACAGCVADDQRKAAYGEGKARDKDCGCKGACCGAELDDPGIVTGERGYGELAIEEIGDEEEKKSPGDPTDEDVSAALIDEECDGDSHGEPGDPDHLFEGQACGKPRRKCQMRVVQSTETGLKEECDATHQSDKRG